MAVAPFASSIVCENVCLYMYAGGGGGGGGGAATLFDYWGIGAAPEGLARLADE